MEPGNYPFREAAITTTAAVVATAAAATTTTAAAAAAAVAATTTAAAAAAAIPTIASVSLSIPHVVFLDLTKGVMRRYTRGRGSNGCDVCRHSLHWK